MHTMDFSHFDPIIFLKGGEKGAFFTTENTQNEKGGIG
jgi:hypothetical protein